MGMWREQDPELNEDGTVKIGGMWEHQRQWWNMDKFIKAMVSGYGGGKTISGGKRAIATALLNNGIPNMVVSPSYPQANKTTVYTIEELLDGKKIPYKYNAQKHEFKFRYKGRSGLIWIGSGEIPKSLKGPNLGCYYIDEPFIQPKAVFDQGLARCRHPAAKIREIGLLGTPEELNWGYDICDGDDKNKYDIGLVQVASMANKALPQETIDNMLAGYDVQAAKAFVSGRFVSLTSGMVYRSFSSANIIDELSESRIPSDLIIGMDFNVNPMCAIVGFEENNKFYQFDEIVLKNSDTTAMCKEILLQYPRHSFTVYPDSTGKNKRTVGNTDFKIIKDMLGDNLVALNYPMKNPPLKDRFNAVNGMYCNSDGVRRCFVTRNCKETIKDMEQITHPYDEYKRKNEPRGRVHCSDAKGYIIHRRYPVGGRPGITIT